MKIFVLMLFKMAANQSALGLNVESSIKFFVAEKK